MRILYCMNSLGGRGGIERVTIVKANALNEIPGNEVGICFTDLGSFPLTIHPLSDKVKVFYLNTPFWGFTSLGLKRIIAFIKNIFLTKKAIEKVISEFRPDVLVNTGSYEKYACALIKKNNFGNLKKIREFHFASNYRDFLSNSLGGKFTSKIVSFFEKYILSHFFDCSYLLTKQDLKENYTHPFIGKINYQYNPCSFSEQYEFKREARRKTILAVGRICQQKNFEDLIEIWSKVAPGHPDWTLRIVGGSQGDIDYLRKIAKNFNVVDRIELPGWSSDIASEMKTATLLCMTSRYEGMPLVLIEAMHYGLPVLAWQFPYGPSELIRNNKNGYVTDYLDKEKFATALNHLLSNPDKIESMRIPAINTSKSFTPYEIAKQWMINFESC